jgi:hypothetical protein
MHPAALRCSSVTYFPVCSLLAPCGAGASAPEYVTVIMKGSTKREVDGCGILPAQKTVNLEPEGQDCSVTRSHS